MKMRFEKNGTEFSTDSPTLTAIDGAVDDLHSLTFMIIENERGDYIQCTGDHQTIIIEARFYSNGSFKHFVIGHHAMSKTWHYIQTKVGLITVLGHEKMSIDDVRDLFKHFCSQSEILPSYNKRNITKRFKQEFE